MSTIAAGTTSGTALVSTGDTNGTLVLQTNGTTTAVTIGTNQVVTLAQPLPAGSGGTGITTTPTAGAVPYGNGTTLAYTAAGTSGQVLTSAGSGAPTWGSAGVTATAKGSVIGFGPRALGGTSGTTTVTAFGTPNLYTTPMRTSHVQMLSSNGSTSSGVVFAPSYSTYYGGWFCVMGQVNTTTTTFQNLFFSYDGFSWAPVITQNAAGWSGYFAMGVCVNDYNGNIYLLATTASAIRILTSTDSGLTFGTSQVVDASWGLQGAYGGMCFIDVGTQATSRAVAWYMNNNGEFSFKTLAGNGTPSSGWATPSGGSVVGMSNMGYTYRQYGTKLSVVGDYTVVYDASTNTASNVVNTSIGTITNASNLPIGLAFNNSYWIGSTGTGVRYGTISGTTLTAVGTVTLSSSTAGTFYSTVYDGTYWYLFGDNGMWYTAAANPSSGWTKASPQLGAAFYTSSYSGYGSSSYSMYQRNPV